MVQVRGKLPVRLRAVVTRGGPDRERRRQAARERDARHWAEEMERLKAPNAYSFLPWLLMGAGAFSNLFQGDAPSPWLAGAGLLTFNSLYVTVVFSALGRNHRWQGDPRVARLALCGLAGVTYALAIGFGGDWLMFFTLLSLAVGIAAPSRRLGQLLAPLAGSAVVIALLKGDGVSDALSIGYGAFISGLVTAAILSLFRAVEQLRATRQELARNAVAEERLRFSRDLHDLLGHTLSVVVVKSEAARRLAPRDLDAALVHVADIEAIGRQALTEIREAVTGYREGSLATELDKARSALSAAGVEAVVQQSGQPLPPQTEALLGWVVREGVTNVVRHSGANQCRITLTTCGGQVRLEMTDNGAGDGTGGVPGTGSGLRGLTERLGAVGGSLTAGRLPRGGFRVVAELPLDEELVVRAGGVGAGR